MGYSKRFLFDVDYDLYLSAVGLSHYVDHYALIDSFMVRGPLAQCDAIYFRLDGPGVFVNDDYVEDACIAVLSELSPNLVTTINRQKFWMVALYRGVLARLLRIDARRQNTKYLSWDHIPWLRDLTHDLRHAPTDQVRVALCDEAFSLAAARMLEESPVEAAVHYMVRTKGLISVNQLAHRVGVNRRKLERAFAARLRTTPHFELRARRFIHTLSQLRDNPEIAWKDLDYAPYADQSHFIKEAHVFLHATPSGAVLAERKERRRFYSRDTFVSDTAVSKCNGLADWTNANKARLDYLAACASLSPKP